MIFLILWCFITHIWIIFLKNGHKRNYKTWITFSNEYKYYPIRWILIEIFSIELQYGNNPIFQFELRIFALSDYGCSCCSVVWLRVRRTASHAATVHLNAQHNTYGAHQHVLRPLRMSNAHTHTHKHICICALYLYMCGLHACFSRDGNAFVRVVKR